MKSSGTRLRSRSSTTRTVAPSSAPDSPACGSSSPMCDASTSRSYWLASMRSALDSLVRTSLRQAGALVSTESDRDCSERSCVQLTLFGPSGFSSKTLRSFGLEADAAFSPNLFRADIPGATESLPRLMSARGTSATDGGAWQTLVADDAVMRSGGKWNSRGEPKLSAQVKLLPTLTKTNARQGVNSAAGGASAGVDLLPRALTKLPTLKKRDYRTGDRRPLSESGRHSLNLNDGLAPGGQMNPTWCEWFMGFPIHHTELPDSETRKFPFARRSPGSCSADPDTGTPE